MILTFWFRHEWLFICDNMDAIFKNSDSPPAGIIDKIAASGVLGLSAGEEVSTLFFHKTYSNILAFFQYV